VADERTVLSLDAGPACHLWQNASAMRVKLDRRGAGNSRERKVEDGEFGLGQVCPNGHASTGAADRYTELCETFCSRCGEATITQCPSCDAPIRGTYFLAGYLSTGDYSAPAHCHNCGAAFPWTERRIAGAVELLEVDGSLSPAEITQFKTDLVVMTKDTPQTQVASLRFKKVMLKVGKSVADSVREIIVSVLSEVAKNQIKGG
jgi:hypothetical protein